MSVLDNKKRNKTVRQEIVKLSKTFFKQKYLEIVLKDLWDCQDTGGFVAVVKGIIPSRDWNKGCSNINQRCLNVEQRCSKYPDEFHEEESVDITQADTLFPVVACWPLDNEGSAQHLGLAISNRSRHKCRKCLINKKDIRTPGVVGQLRNYEASNAMARAAEKALRKKYCGVEDLTATDHAALETCAFFNILKTPTLHNSPQRGKISSNPYSSCPYDDLHTMSEGLLKAWVVWTVICAASVEQLDPRHYHDGLHVLDSKLMSFPSIMVPEVLRRHRFPQVNNVVETYKACIGIITNVV